MSTQTTFETLPRSAVTNMAAYIAGCQPEVVERYGARALRFEEEPDNISADRYMESLRALLKYDERAGIEMTGMQVGGLLLEATFLVSSTISEEFQVDRPLNVPKKFERLPEGLWLQISPFYKSRSILTN